MEQICIIVYKYPIQLFCFGQFVYRDYKQVYSKSDLSNVRITFQVFMQLI